MESINISFSANGQQLTGGGLYCASNTVHYIIADFELGDGWQGFDSVRAVWSNDFKCISTVLDQNGSCTVPHEVLERRGKVSVNLVGSILEDDELTDRLTTYPVLAITVDANAKICGTETAEVTPSQFEQYIAQVIAEVEKVTGMTAVAVPLPEGSDPTASYEDGVLTLGIPKGEKGDTGNGIESVEFNSDYSLTFYFTEGDPYTTPSIRGARGAQGYGIVSVEKIGSVGLVDTYQVNYENPEIEPTTFTVTNGAKGDTGNGIESAVLNDDYTLTLTFTDGTEYTTPSIRGEQGEPGEVTLAELASVLPTDTASGAIASFEDGSDLFDYLSCVVNITPVQDLHGYDKPWVGGAGKNKLDVENRTSSSTISTSTYALESCTVSKSNATYTATITGSWSKIKFGIGGLTDGQTYTLSAKFSNPNATSIGLAYHDGSYKGTVTSTDTSTRMQMTFTYSSSVGFVAILVNNRGTSNSEVVTVSEIQLEQGSSFTSYEPYENLCPITGWTGCEVDVSGVNVWDEEWESGKYDASGAKASDSLKIRSKDYISVKPSTSYYFENTASNGFHLCFYDASKTFISEVGVNGDTSFTTPNNAFYMTFNSYNAYGTTYNNDISINYPSTDTTYHAHNGTTYLVSWQDDAGTVYGGTVDVVSGVLTVTHGYADLSTLSWEYFTQGVTYPYFRTDSLNSVVKRVKNNSEVAHMICSHYQTTNANSPYLGNVDHCICSVTWGQIQIYNSDYTDSATFKASLNGAQLVYELATPTTYQLDPVQVACLLGHNNVWADCGSIDEVKYKADVQLWVLKKLGE